MKSPAFYTASLAIGDLICATPTIRKISEVYNTKVIVFSHHPEIFENLPYVSESLDVKDYITLDKSTELREKYDLHYSFWRMGQKISLSDDRGIEMKHAMIDIRQYHAIDNGFMLKSSELHCDFSPRNEILDVELPEEFVVLHPFKNWPSRTWDTNNWNLLIKKLSENNIPVVVVGKDAIDNKLIDYLKKEVTGKTDERVFNELERKKSVSNSLENFGIIDLTNKTTISQVWKIINKAKCVVTMDSGILHLAGTTDTHIVQLGSSIHPEFRAPYRHGKQSYKYSYVAGGCNLFCASNMKYSLRDWEFGYNGGTPLQSVTLIDTCLEKKKTFECHPSADKVFDKILQIWTDTISETEKNEVSSSTKSEVLELRTLVQIQPVALGDNIGAMAVIEKYRKVTGKKITVTTNFANIFQKSYPELEIIQRDKDKLDFFPTEGYWQLGDNKYTESIVTTYKFDVPLLTGFAKDFGIEDVSDVTLKVDNPGKQRPIKGKYVCLGVHSTSQCKYWNFPGGWDDLCKYLRKKDITPVCVEKHESFGIEGNFNQLPSKALKKIGMPFDDVINYISHAELFIGVSSGLSWLAQSLGVPTVIISNVTSKDNEYLNDKTLRIYDESVCHGCFHKYTFNAGDWLWCPVYRNDNDRRFICSKAITPETVIEKIENFITI